MKKMNYHHGDLKNAIFKSSHKLLKKNKPEDISLRSVAELAGVSHAAIYRHFKDKDELLEIMASFGFDRLANAQKKAFDNAGNPEAGIIKLGMAYIKFAITNPYYYKIMFFTKRANARKELKRAQLKSYLVLVHACRDFLNKMKRKSDPREYALMCWSLVHGYSNLVLETDYPKSEAAALHTNINKLAENALKNAIH